jgi:tRNA(Arg) A34 adenosine deaminase TadA
MSRAASPVTSRLDSRRTPSTQDYFELLRRRALQAREDGNYAIAAALVIRERGIETVTVGANTVFGSRDPSGHAEMNAIRLAHELGVHDAKGPSKELPDDESVLVRRIPDAAHETILLTTLEPCPMCTVCILNAGIQRVVIAAADAPSGSMLEHRLESLPHLWPDLARTSKLEIGFCQSEHPEIRETYLPRTLRSELVEIFLDSRESLDATLSGDGVLDTRSITASAKTLLPGAGAPPHV